KRECRRPLLAITLAEYQEAVNTLLSVASTVTSEGRITANLLLSLYDSTRYTFPIDDLSLLDLELMECAMTVIRGRVLLGQVPQVVIKGGGIQFARLAMQWPQLKINPPVSMASNMR